MSCVNAAAFTCDPIVCEQSLKPYVSLFINYLQPDGIPALALEPDMLDPKKPQLYPLSVLLSKNLVTFFLVKCPPPPESPHQN